MNTFAEIRETAERAFHQGYKVRDSAKTKEALFILAIQLLDWLGPTEEFDVIFQVLDEVKNAVEQEDWESGTAPLLAVVAKLQEVEAFVEQRAKSKSDEDSQVPKLGTPQSAGTPFAELADAYKNVVEDFRARHQFFPPPDSEIEQASCCPFCGWDCQEYWQKEDCPHFLTDLLCDWDEFSPQGTCRGAFESIGASLGPLNEAVVAFLLATGMDGDEIGALAPPRLGSLVKTVAGGAEISDAEVGRDFEADTTAFRQYIIDVCQDVGVEVQIAQYDSGDPYGTCPFVFWTADAEAAARLMATAVADDANRLKAKAE